MQYKASTFSNLIILIKKLKKFLELKRKGYRDGIKKRDKIGMHGVRLTAHNGITQCVMPMS